MKVAAPSPSLWHGRGANHEGAKTSRPLARVRSASFAAMHAFENVSHSAAAGL